MVTKKSTIDIIRAIIDRNYSRLIVSVLGNQTLTEKELEELRQQGIDTSNPDSLLSLAYHHSFINYPVDAQAPKSVDEMEDQQSVSGLKPTGEANDYSIENLNDKTKQHIEKMKLDVMSRVEAIIRENNDSYKVNALQNMDRSDTLDELTKESSLGRLKQKLRDTSGDANRDWLRIAVTEMSNAIGIGSVDRIVTENRDADLKEIYVYRIIVPDAKTCKWCRRFYQDSDSTPKLYRLSTLLSNGSNYGKRTDDWKPVAQATHPNERCSQVLELKPGFKLSAGGSVSYIGLDKWNDYLVNKIDS